MLWFYNVGSFFFGLLVLYCMVLFRVGFISLEEIDESVYGLIGELPVVEDGKSKKKFNYDLKSKKKKKRQRDENVEIVEDGSHLTNVEDGKNKKKLNYDLKLKTEKRQRDEDVEIVEESSHLTNADKGEEPSKSKTKKRKVIRNKKDSEESEDLKGEFVLPLPPPLFKIWIR